jgi:hypothetical protein
MVEFYQKANLVSLNSESLNPAPLSTKPVARAASDNSRQLGSRPQPTHFSPHSAIADRDQNVERSTTSQVPHQHLHYKTKRTKNFSPLSFVRL